jgi:hypothetical protein
MKIDSEGAELIHAVERTDRETNMPKLIVVLRNFLKASKNTEG